MRSPFTHNGDVSELALFICGLLALCGLVARLVGVWS